MGTEWGLISGVVLAALAYIFGRKVSEADVKSKLALAENLKAETHSADIANLRSMVEAYKLQVEDVQKDLLECKQESGMFINALKKTNILLEKQVKELKVENSILKIEWKTLK